MIAAIPGARRMSMKETASTLDQKSWLSFLGKLLDILWRKSDMGEIVKKTMLRECFYCGKEVTRPCVSEETAEGCVSLQQNLEAYRCKHGGKYKITAVSVDKPTGGPSSYYDLPSDLRTLNDLLEYLSARWGKYALHWKDIMKAGVRFGTKDGTDTMYDAKKVVYFGARLILMIGGKKAVREYLEELINDKQFKD